MTSPLTPMQEKCLRALADHGSYALGAKAVGLNPNTFKAHVRDAYAALNVPGRVEAFRAMGWLRTVEVDGLTFDADIWSRT